MRELKFRCWYKGEWTHKEPQKMEYFTFLELFGVGTNDDEDDFEWMQFTGLQDKNGKDIYEGDIVTRTEVSDTLYEVIYQNGYYALSNFNLIAVIDWVNTEIEIIGNIHENKELITKNQ